MSSTYLTSLLNSNISPLSTVQCAVCALQTKEQMSLVLSEKAVCTSASTMWNSLSDNCQQAEPLSTVRSKTVKEGSG